MTRPTRSALATESGFTLVELLLVMAIFAIVGTGLLAVVRVWFATSQATTTQAIWSADSQNLSGDFVVDVGSTVLPSSQTGMCAPFSFTWKGILPDTHTYTASYAVAGSTLQRNLSNGVTSRQSTVVHDLTTLSGQTTPLPVCMTALGTSRTLTVSTTMAGVTASYAVTGYARGIPATALLGSYPRYVNAGSRFLYGTYLDNVIGSSIVSVAYNSCVTLSCTWTNIATFSPPGFGASLEGVQGTNPPYSLLLNLNGDNTYSVEAVVTYTTNTSANATVTSNVDTTTLDTAAPTVTLTAAASTTDDSTPAFSGTAGTVVAGNTTSADSPIVTVNVYSGATTGGALVQSATTTASGGAWSVTLSAPLADGTYTVQASQSDVAGNIGLSSSTATFVVDATAPGVSLSAPPNNGGTNDDTPTYSGTAGTVAATGTTSADLSAITIKIYAGLMASGTPLQTLTTTASGGAWSVTPTVALTHNASYTAQASQTDAAGNIGTSTSTFVIDTEVPRVTLTAPADSSTTNDATPTFSGTAGAVAASSTTTADSATVTVRIYSGTTTGGTLVQTVTGPASAGAWSATPTTALADGTYTAQASQADGAGSTGVSSTRTFLVDATVPAVTLTLPANNGGVSGTTPSYSGTAGALAATSSSTADQPGITVNVYAGTAATGTPLQTLAATASGGAWSVTPTVALTANATYTAQASQADGAGNVGTSTSTFVVDTVIPVVTLTVPANNGTSNNSTPTLSGTAGAVAASSSATADSATVTVRIYSGTTTGGTLVQTVTGPTSAGSWSAAPPVALADGTYTAQASQTDLAGNTGVSAANTFVVDTVAPIVTLTAPANGASTKNTKPVFTGAAGALTSSTLRTADLPTITVRIYSGATTGGTLVQTLTATASAGAWTVTPSTALSANATYTAQASQSDGAGNAGLSSANTFVVDTAAPAPTVTSPASGGSTNNTTPTLSGTAGNAVATSTTSADLTAITVKIYSGTTTGGTLLETLTSTESGGSWSVAATALAANATYTAQASQTDAAGNTGASAARTFVVDTVAPSPAVTSPANGGATNDTTPTLSGTAGNAVTTSTTGPDLTTITVKIYSGATTGGTLLETLTHAASAGTWSLTATALAANATYTAQASQTDAAGNTGVSSANTFVIDTVIPIVSLVAPPTNQTRPTFSGTAGAVTSSSTTSADLPTITVRIYSGTGTGGTLVQTLTATASGGTWSVAPTTSLSFNGTYTAQASQSDGAGNVGLSVTRTFVA